MAGSQFPEDAGTLRALEHFCFPSEVENFPNVLLEAMAAEMAIVTTKGTGCEEVVGDAAVLVDPGDVAAIRREIRRLVQQPSICRELGQAARKRLEENFGWETIARRYVALYERERARRSGGL